MASYRFSGSIVKRSAGRSATAAAAYRAADVIQDERYGETHDYTRKGGVEHSEILTPDDAPEWMQDRGKLWNAVEAAEKRKDAQLAREIQLSLPHELDAEQRRELVRQFVLDQFVARGMIADLNIHAPHAKGDERNHHAHVMLTMRELMGEGFGKKDRSWNDPKNLERWREEWAQVQNLAFERLGLDVRVDHRSLEAQGIDREPQQHEGPHVTAMRRRGEETRIGAENDQRREDNQNRAEAHQKALEAKLARELERFESWAGEKVAELDAAQQLSKLDREQEAGRAADQLEERIQGYYGEHLATVRAEIDSLEKNLNAGWIKGAWRKITGRDAIDRKRLEAMQLTAHDAEQRMQEMRARLQTQQDAQREALEAQQEQRRQQQAEGIQRARERKEEALEAQRREAMPQPPESRSLAERLQDAAQEIERDQANGDHQPRQDKNRDRGFEPER